MAGRKDKSSQSFRGSRIALAVAVGVLLGCAFAFLFPNGFFTPVPQTKDRASQKSALQVRSDLSVGNSLL